MYDPPNFSLAGGCHVARRRGGHGDRRRVGSSRYVAVDDVRHGDQPARSSTARCTAASRRAIAQALFEEAVYDEDGQPRHRLDGQLHRAVGGRAAVLRARPRRGTPSPTNPLGRQGRRRDRHDRLAAGRDERGRRRARAARRDRRRHAGLAGAGLARDPGGEASDPARRSTTSVAGSVEQAIELLGSAEDAKLLAGGHSLLPLMKLRFARPSLARRHRPHRPELRVRPRRRRPRSRSARSRATTTSRTTRSSQRALPDRSRTRPG